MKYLSYRLSAAMWARVLVLWIILAIGFLSLGILSFGLGRFMQDNVRTELASQKISFSPVANMTDEEKKIPGMVENAGQDLTTGNQARIYSDLMALHISEAANAAGYPGATYATLGGVQRQLRAAVDTATKANDKAALDDAQAKLNVVNNLRNTIQTGSTLRGTLLSAYGWDNVATGITTASIFIIILAVIFLVLFIYELRRGHLPPTEA